jgi:hypothetical protein
MGKAIPYDMRVKIIRDWQSGHSVLKIKGELGISETGIRGVIRRYEQFGEQGYQTDYHHCGKSQRHFYSEAIEAEVERRRLRGPGSYYVSSVLADQFQGQRTPSARTILRRWSAAGGNPRKKSRPAQKANEWSEEVHHTWQIDGKEQIKLADSQQVSWANIADEATGTDLLVEVFPPGDDE